MVTVLIAFCYECDTEVEVYGYYEGLDEDWQEQWKLVDPFPDGDSHQTHDLHIERQL
jgi:hypothetical protein